MNRTHRLLHAVDLGPTGSSSAAGELSLPTSNLFSFGSMYREVTFTVVLLGLVGAPTAAKMDVKFQLGVSDKDGDQDTAPVWFDLETEQIAKLIAEGVAWKRAALAAPTIYDSATDAAPTSSAPIVVQRTIKDFGKKVRIQLSPTFTAGATPRIKTTVVAHGKA